jgi:hypothetical protein
MKSFFDPGQATFNRRPHISGCFRQHQDFRTRPLRQWNQLRNVRPDHNQHARYSTLQQAPNDMLDYRPSAER